MTLFAHSVNVVLWLVLTKTAHGQLTSTPEENSPANVTVQSVQITAPSQDSGQYIFTFNMSSGEELKRDGKLREVNGKREVVMTGYIKETINRETHWLRYAADENGKNIMIASRTKAVQADRNLPGFNIEPDESGLLSRMSTTVSPHGSPGLPVNASRPLQSETDLVRLQQPLPCTPFFHLCIPKMDTVLEALTQNYDKQIRPGFYDQPTQVWADFHIRGLLEIDEVDMEFKLSVALTLDWYDDRLKVHGTSYPINFVFPKTVLVDAEQATRIWTPQVTVLNEKESVEYSDIFDKGSLFWNPYDGQLILTKYGVLTLTCSMSLQNFPMDTQICSVMVGSNVYGNDAINLAGNLALDPIFSNFVTNMELVHYGERGYVTKGEGPHGVNQTILVCDLLMKRHVGYYLIGTYFPAALVVIISWLTFWMPREGSAERMALGVTCVLTITTLLISSQSSSPKVSYVKAIDIYMVVCFGLIFATLLQSTFIGYLLRKAIISDGCKSKCPGEIDGKGESEHNARLTWVIKRIMAGEMEINDEVKILKLLKMSDAWSRILFPLLFIVFNVTYWAYYGTIWNELGESRNWRDPVKRGITMQVHSWFGENGM